MRHGSAASFIIKNLLFKCNGFLGLFRDSFGRDAEGLEDEGRLAAAAELVVYAVAHDGHRAVLRDELGNSSAETAQHVRLFRGDDGAGLLGSLQNQLGVERLDGVHVDDAGGDAVLGEQLARGERHLDVHADGDDRDVGAVREHGALAQLKLIAGDGVGHGLDGEAAETHVGRAVIVEQGFGRETHFVAVARAEHCHAGDRAHEGEVLDALMGRAVFADGQAAVAAHDLDVQMRVADGVAHLLPGAAGCEHGEGVDKGLVAAERHAAGDADHVGLGDAHVEEALGMRFFKEFGHGRAGEVGVEHDKLGIFVGQLYERLAVGLTSCNLFTHGLTLQFLDDGFELRLRLRELLVVRGLAVPAGVVLHVAHALALDRLGEDHGGLALDGLGFLVGGLDLLEVMAVDLDDVPAEGLELLVEGLGRHDVLGRAVDLQPVHIDAGAEIVEMILGGGHHGLPDLALGQLAVAKNGVDAVVLVGLLAGQRHAGRHGNALAQGAGGHVDAGIIVHLDVAGHVALDAAEHFEVFHGEEAAQRQHGVDGGRAVALGHHKPVAVGVLRVLGIDAHLGEIQIRQHVHAA